MPLTHLSNFCKTLVISLTISKINLILNWSENGVLKSKPTRNADPNADPAIAAINHPTDTIFKITQTDLYVPVVTLSTKNSNKLLEQLKIGLKRTINGINTDQK